MYTVVNPVLEPGPKYLHVSIFVDPDTNKRTYFVARLTSPSPYWVPTAPIGDNRVFAETALALLQLGPNEGDDWEVSDPLNWLIGAVVQEVS